MRANSKQQICRVAFVGAGYMTREHAKAFAALPSVELTGIFSRTAERAQELASQYGIANVCGSVDDLYANGKPDLVVVSVPELQMNSVARACFKHPWTVMLEKPAGYDIADAKDVLAAAKAAGSRVFVALNRRWYGSTRAAMADLQSNRGARYIRVLDQQDQAAALAAGQPAKVVENWMYANSIHTVDYFHVFGRGKVVRVEPVVRWDPKNPWMVVAKISFDSGDIGLYEGVWRGPGPWAVTVATPAKRWELRPLEHAAYQEAGSRKLVALDLEQRDSDFKAGIYTQAEQAVAAALGEPNKLPTLDDALQSMLLVQQIFA